MRVPLSALLWIQVEAQMSKRKWTKLVHEGNYVARLDVELLEEPEGWSPYLSLEDAYRLDDVREALRRGTLRPLQNIHAQVNNESWFYVGGSIILAFLWRFESLVSSAYISLKFSHNSS